MYRINKARRFAIGFGEQRHSLIGLVGGTVVAWILGDATFSEVGSSSWVGVTTPFFFGIPKFSFAAIVSMIIVMMITAVFCPAAYWPLFFGALIISLGNGTVEAACNPLVATIYPAWKAARLDPVDALRYE